EGLAADVTARGSEALWLAQAHAYDVVVLDVMLPDLNGFDVCRRLRDAGIWSPVLMLTARDSVEDRVQGLDSGADDYPVKPFAFENRSNVIDVYVRRLRRKIDEPFGRESIETVRGVGYRIRREERA